MTKRDEGFTLAEVLVALAILGIASVALVGAMGNLVVSSSIHRGFSGTDTLARAYVEDVQKLAQDTPWSCTTTFAPGTVTTGYSVSTSWSWIDLTTGASLPGATLQSACEGYAAVKCPAETSPYPSECTPGAMRLVLNVTRPGDAGHTSVRTDTTTMVRRANA